MESRKIRNVLIVAVLAVLAWRVLSLGMADHLARDKPAQALFWRSNHPEALFRMAEQSVAEKKWPQANEYALKAVKANRLDGRALRVMAQVAEHEGDEKRAAELFNKAVALSPRDVPSHVWLLEYALRQRQAKPAAVHMDALLRVAPELVQRASAASGGPGGQSGGPGCHDSATGAESAMAQTSADGLGGQRVIPLNRLYRYTSSSMPCRNLSPAITCP